MKTKREWFYYFEDRVDFDDSLSMRDAFIMGRESMRDEASQTVTDFAKHYPESVFVPPPAGQHGKTVDACSAAAIRGVIPSISKGITDIQLETE